MKYIAALVLSLGLAGTASAAAIDQFKSFLATTKSAKGDFSQFRPGKSGASSGTFVFARPGKFIWTYEKPFEQVIHSDGSRVFLWDKDLNQVSTKKMGAAVSASPAAILFGSSDPEKLFVLTEDGKEYDAEWVKVVPKKTDESFEYIRIAFSKNTPVLMELTDKLDQKTMIRFSNFQKNPTLPSFKFVYPERTDVTN